MVNQKWKTRKKGSTKQKGKRFKSGSSKVKGARKSKKYWIQGSINKEEEGDLTKWAKRHNLTKSDGTIDLGRAEKYAQNIKSDKERLKRIRQINWAQTVTSFNQ
jgi:hypothetical protein